MSVNYHVSTQLNLLEEAAQGAVAMIDGTIPGWIPGYYDLHYDHHRPGGARVQLDELPEPTEVPILVRERENHAQNTDYPTNFLPGWTIATTLVDADACVAAAWLQLTSQELTLENRRKLRAIALDCDYLCIPPTEASEYHELADFAAKAVAGLKVSTKDLHLELGLPANPVDRTDEQRSLWASTAFQRGTEWLIAAVRGERPFPGESGEADHYLDAVKADAEQLRSFKMVRVVRDCLVVDLRSVGRYVDPRCLVILARQLGVAQPVTLTCHTKLITVGGPFSIPGYKHILGTLQYLPRAADIDLTGVFPTLAGMEAARRELLDLPAAETSWGGRAAVGGSGFNDGSFLQPDEVIDVVLAALP